MIVSTFNDGASVRCVKLNFSNSTGDAPQLANHVAATDGSDVYVFGGFNGESYTNQTWKLEFSGIGQQLLVLKSQRL